MNIRRLFRLDSGRSRLERDVDEELHFHVEMRAADLRDAANRAGVAMSEEEALAAAMKEFGDVARYRDDCRAIGTQWEREMKISEVLGSVVGDVRYGWRSLWRAPSFAIVSLLTLMLGIGATSSIFTVVNGVLLTPLPYDRPDRIVHIGERKVTSLSRGGTTSYENYADWQRDAKSFAAMGLYDGGTATIMMGEPDRRKVSYVTSGVFDVFKLKPVYGRVFQPSDNRPDAPTVAVITDAFWKQHMGGTPDAIGKPVRFSSIAPIVVGILPPFDGPPELNGEVWLNFANDGSDGRGGRSKDVVARLADGATLAAAQAELTGIAARLAKDYPEQNEGMTVVADPIADLFVGNVRGMLMRLLGASALVLLIACANLSSLLIARGLARRRELAVRTALGAEGGRVMRQMLTESLLLAGLGAVLGLAFAYGATKGLLAIGPSAITDRPVLLDWRVLGFTLGAAMVSGVFFGIAPAWRARSVDLQAALREGGRGASSRAARARGVLTILQLAMAVILLANSGLLIKSFRKVVDVDPGVRTDDLLTFSMVMTSASYPDIRAVPPGVDAYVEKLKGIPGVTSVAGASLVPMHGDFDRISVDIEGMPDLHGASEPEADRYVVTTGYFDAMGVSLKRGRLFVSGDSYESAPVTVLDEVFAKRTFGATDPLGRRMKIPGRDSMATVVGIVSHVKTYGMEVESPGQIYVSHEQYPWRWMKFAVRTKGDPWAVAPAVRKLARETDPRQPAYELATMDESVGRLLQSRRFALSLVIAFAGVALLLAAVGLYGLVAYSISQRRREIGIRVALGAVRGDVMRLVARQSGALAGAGIILGIVGSIASGRVVAGMLFGVEPHDASVLLIVGMILAGVAVIASIGPARRATRIDAVEVMRD